MIIIDECVTRRLGEWLRQKGLEDILCINDWDCLKGMDDETIGVFGHDTRALLITSDKQFSEKYNHTGLPSIYITKKTAWRKIYKELNHYGYT